MSYIIQKMRAKLHNAVVNAAFPDYEGSVTIGKTLLQYSGIEPGERVQVLNITNGERIETYVIEGAEGREIALNGAAAHQFKPNDHVIIIAYAYHMRGRKIMSAFSNAPEKDDAPEPKIVILDGTAENLIKETINKGI
jgi:aspartate 1-decarboxylase